MTIYDFKDYKAYVRARLDLLPKGGRGEFRRIASHLGVHTTLISQIFGGRREFTIEQGVELAGYFGLGERETHYLVGLVESARAGTPALRRIIEKRLNALSAEAQDLATRLPQDRVLAEKEKATFYSRWSYSGVRLFAPLTGGATASIAASLNLSREHVSEVLEFLLTHGLLTRTPQGGFELGAKRIHVPSDSPLVIQHHRNWRTRTLQRVDSAHRLGDDELMFTAPMSIASSDRPKIRKLLLDLIDEVSRIVEASDPTSLACLNLDWVNFTDNRNPGTF